ncbi:MAG: thiamine S protein [Methanomicrobiales archaeon]|nr:thiamine S protein [Methanomicrobiales archaeon]
MLCRFTILLDNTVLIYRGGPDDTYETALLSFGINPDTVLIFYENRSLPQDKRIEEEEVSILLTASRG